MRETPFSRDFNTLEGQHLALGIRTSSVSFAKGLARKSTLSPASKETNRTDRRCFLHRGESRTNPEARQYVTYESGKWDGVMAAWNADGKKRFWCNYLNGQRHGLCCLFNEDALTAVLECSRSKINVIHLIAANQISKSFADADEASADEAAGAVLKEIDRINRT